MTASSDRIGNPRVLVTGAALAILIYALQAAQSVLVPVLLSAFLATAIAPLVFWMYRKGVSAGAAVVLGVGGATFALALVVVLVGASVEDFATKLPTYREQLQERMSSLVAGLGGFGQELSSLDIWEHLDPGVAMGLVSEMLSGLGGALGNTFLIVFTVLFLLSEAFGFSAKLRAAFGGSDDTSSVLASIIDSVKSYISLKTIISLVTGAAVGIWVALLGLDYAILWGVLAFLLNYIPNIGSILAAVPAVLLAFVQFGLTKAVIVGAGYIAINVVIGNVVEPKLMGKGLGLSTLVVFLSLVFWGWVFGPVGMLLSVPLTMTVKIALAASPETEWISVLLGPPPAGTENDASRATAVSNASGAAPQTT